MTAQRPFSLFWIWIGLGLGLGLRLGLVKRLHVGGWVVGSTHCRVQTLSQGHFLMFSRLNQET